MDNPVLPYIIEPAELSSQLTLPKLLIVDVGTAEQYRSGHIPGAVNLDYTKVRCEGTPTPGKLPGLAELKAALQEIGLDTDSHVVAYDHENNARACRLLWVLEACSQFRHSLLNGGMTAWANADMPVEQQSQTTKIGNFVPVQNPDVMADAAQISAAINDQDIQILDARSPDEYMGIKSASARKGRIPGAIHLDWMDTVDIENDRRFKSKQVLQNMLTDRHLDRDSQVIVHCQTHQRSSHSFVMLRYMGFGNVRGYGGSWSEWGNNPDLPLVTG